MAAVRLRVPFALGYIALISRCVAEFSTNVVKQQIEAAVVDDPRRNASA
jgi:hypothetical protein